MSTVKFSSVQFGHDGIGLQFSRQCLMGYIHHYWLIAKSSCVLAGKVRDERERWVEREDKDGECARGMEKEENKEVRSENHYGGIRSGEIIHEPVKM